MTPKEKANELIDKMYFSSLKITKKNAKECALIAVDLHLEDLSKMKLIFSDRELHYKYWNEVKQELQKI